MSTHKVYQVGRSTYKVYQVGREGWNDPPPHPRSIPVSVIIAGAEWRDRTAGVNYQAARVHATTRAGDVYVARLRAGNGSGDHYVSRALEVVGEIFPRAALERYGEHGGHEAPWRWSRRTGIPFIATLAEVRRWRDLTDWGYGGGWSM